MNNMLPKALIVASLLAFLPAAAWAERPRSRVIDEKVIYKKKTEVDFTDETVTGDLTRPEGDYLVAEQRARHKKLIKIRTNFKARILRSIAHL